MSDEPGALVQVPVFVVWVVGGSIEESVDFGWRALSWCARLYRLSCNAYIARPGAGMVCPCVGLRFREEVPWALADVIF